MTQVLERHRAARTAPRRRAVPPRPVARAYRPDIEGLRAVAVLAVVIYHAGLGISGGYVGVDVFFVISGFLITGQLMKSVSRDGARALPTFYARRVRRLLPAAAVVVVATVVVTRLYAPPLQVRPVAVDALTTTFYGLNYRLAIDGTQYLQANSAVSPLQHFWSLAVEEQFYLVWPALLAIAMYIGRRHRVPVVSGLLVVVSAVSFYLCVTVTKTAQPWAYFSLHTRAWELAAGALVSLGATQLTRLPGAVAEGLGLAGVGAVVGAAFLFDDTTPFPGHLAAVPVLGGAAVLAAGCGRRRRIERVLGEPLMQCLGRVSYSWYLWHWPMLSCTPMVLGHALTAPQRAAVVVFSLAAAVATFFTIEDPVRHFQRPNLHWLGGGAVISAAVVAASVLVITHLPSTTGHGGQATLARIDSTTPAAVTAMRRAVAAGLAVRAVPANLDPALSAASKSLPGDDGTDCHADFTVVAQGSCVFGDPAGPHTAVLVGDSHADQWLPAFDRAGKARKWKVVSWTKSACPAARWSVTNRALNRTYTECDTWRARTVARIRAMKPDIVFVSGSENLVGAEVTPADWARATVTTLQAVKATPSSKVVLLQDIPIPGYDMPTCLTQHLDDVPACTIPAAKAHSFPARHHALATTAAAAGFAVVDPQAWICTNAACPPVVGNLLVYRDDSHLTVPFTTWLTPMISRLLTPRSSRR